MEDIQPCGGDVIEVAEAIVWISESNTPLVLRADIASCRFLASRE
jgi:hypothetical protein